MTDKKRFTLEKAILPAEGKLPERSCLFFLDDGIPDSFINSYFIALTNKIDTDTKSGRDNNNIHLHWLKFANFMWDTYGKHYSETTIIDILAFLDSVKKEKIKNASMSIYITTLHKIFSHLMLYFDLDASLFNLTPTMIAQGITTKPNSLIIGALRKLYPNEKQSSIMPRYEKWLTVDQAAKIAKLLRIDYRCIFLISFFTGYRIDSVLSIKLDGFNLNECSVKETRSKTGLIHKAPIPQKLAEEIQNYIDFVRIDREDPLNPCDYLFLGKNGKPVSYHSYMFALKHISNTLGFEVHTHSGRSSFLAMMRTRQLELRKAGKETFADEHLMALMDWKTFSCLHNYDKINRVEDVLPFMSDYFNDICQSMVSENCLEYGDDDNV